MMIKKTAAVALLLLLSAAALPADDFETIYSFTVKGTWKTLGSSDGETLRLEFAADTFTMHIENGNDETVRSGMYIQEAKNIHLIVGNGNQQEQIRVPYTVIDDYTIRIVVDNKSYKLERQE